VGPEDVFKLLDKAFLACFFFNCPVACTAFQLAIFLNQKKSFAGWKDRTEDCPMRIAERNKVPKNAVLMRSDV
jgi:hypothetical protein